MPSSKAGAGEGILTLYEKALRLLEGKKYGEAEKVLAQVEGEARQNMQIRARIQTYRKVCREKIQQDRDEKDNASAYDLGVLHHNLGKHEEALELFEEALETEGDKDHIHMAMAAARMRLGDPEKALESLKEAMELDPSNRIQAWSDPELEPLHDSPEFLKLVRRK